MAKKKKTADNIAAQNRKARHNYFIEQNFEAGIMLEGSEVKSLRSGQASILESYATEQDGELFLINAYIPEYEQAGRFNHQPRRPRKLLMHKKEIEKLKMAVQRDGYTLVPLSIFFNKRGLAKVDLGLGKGKQKVDKRHDLKERDWKRQQGRLMRDRG